ncbi:MAG: recombinase RecA [Deltaproteobacteria bacterium]|nr:recombinase RecA [Deltaproteobacteria bacterium]
MSEKKGTLKSILVGIEKKFGKGTIMTFDSDAERHIDVFSSGSIGLDLALGVRGLPFGRIVEIYGPESSGKTTLTLHAIAEVQRMGKAAAFIDAEHAFDPGYATALGVDLESLIISQPSSGEDALEIAEVLARSGEVGLVVIDSVAALVPKAELEGDMGDSHMGLQARLMGQALRKLTAAANTTGTCLVFINQLRQKIGVTFGSNETTTGGNALKFYASVRLDIRRTNTLKDGDKAYGNRTRVKVAKNKLAPPFQSCEFDILYGKGVCLSGEVIDLGVSHGLIEKSGSWFSFEGERLGQGREKARAALEENPELLARLRELVLDHASVGVATGGNEDVEAEAA